MSRKPERKTYNASELAEVLGIDESTVRRLARTQGHVGGIRAGPGRVPVAPERRFPMITPLPHPTPSHAGTDARPSQPGAPAATRRVAVAPGWAVASVDERSEVAMPTHA